MGTNRCRATKTNKTSKTLALQLAYLISALDEKTMLQET